VKRLLDLSNRQLHAQNLLEMLTHTRTHFEHFPQLLDAKHMAHFMHWFTG
jgi:hypothetical protein